MNNVNVDLKSSVLRNPAVWIGALGNFVAVFDLVLFGIVRTQSLRALGIEGAEVLSVGARVLNFQMAGMLLGGILWGIVGDKRGRVSVLFGSILLYSAATFLNAFVEDAFWYAPLRFIAGVGLAGEFGAGITLLSEALPKTLRAYGTTLVASFGMAGAVIAALVGHSLSWRVAYLVGGGLGLGLLLLRAKLAESGLFRTMNAGVKRGDLRLLFARAERTGRYLRCVLVGIPVWLIAGILMIFAPELAQEMGVQGTVTAGNAILFHCIAAFPGNFIGGHLSHALGSGKRVIFGFFCLTALFFVLFLSGIARTPVAFYALCALSGLACGYFGLFATMAAEQFGTNLRSTVATTVPNFVRGSVVPMALLFQFFQARMGLVWAAAVLAAGTLSIAVLALRGLSESFGRDLNFIEE